MQVWFIFLFFFLLGEVVLAGPDFIKVRIKADTLRHIISIRVTLLHTLSSMFLQCTAGRLYEASDENSTAIRTYISNSLLLRVITFFICSQIFHLL